MVGGEESVPAVQHACLAARPAGWQHRSSRARWAAFARHREPSVAESRPLSAYTTKHMSKCQHLRSPCVYTLWYECVDRQTGTAAQVFTKTGILQLLSPRFIALVHRRTSMHQRWLIINWSWTMKSSWSRRSFHSNFFTTKALFWGDQQKTRKKKIQKPRAKNFSTLKYKYCCFFFLNKHFMRIQTLIACGS